MKIVDVTVQNYSQPMGGLHRGCFQGQQEISLVTVKTDEGVDGYATARAQAEGNVTVPNAPGLGVEIDWDYVDDHTTSRM